MLPAADAVPQRLHAAMRYAVLGGGKRVRPLLVYAAGEVTAADAEALDRAALAVEYVHAYSLVHDDLPCMDNDVLRRGKPTVHVAFDEATAMLAGDALQAEAFRVIADGALPASQTASLMRELAHAAGTQGMCGGQAIDLAAVGQSLALPELERMHRMKTGALLRAAVMMGALSGQAAKLTECTREALSRYGEAIGLAFQVVDDVLDVEGSTDALGKTAGKDAAAAKPTYVTVLGIEGARAQSLRLRAQALEAIAGIGPRANRLRDLADLIVCRNH
ncbi:MAG: polyprenyl synthetase family protein [Burkholderiaceae bacterium]|nr:polyprenyl synthetase family protein [Burkholderiaceae bacterium]